MESKTVQPVQHCQVAIVRRLGVAALLAALLVLSAGAARAQPLVVLPVTIQMEAGQMAASLTIIDRGTEPTSFQVRAYNWTQPDGVDQLQDTDTVLASPPLGTIAAGATQVVRLVLRRPAQDREASYRILVDQIPPPASPGTVRIALRLSIPIFAEPATRVASHLQWRIEAVGGQVFVVAVNDGARHETVRSIALATPDGHSWPAEANVSPYVLPGVTRRWRIMAPRLSVTSGAALRLTGLADTGRIDQPVRAVGVP